jgi:hypothetical protein
MWRINLAHTVRRKSRIGNKVERLEQRSARRTAQNANRIDKILYLILSLQFVSIAKHAKQNGDSGAMSGESGETLGEIHNGRTSEKIC